MLCANNKAKKVTESEGLASSTGNTIDEMDGGGGVQTAPLLSVLSAACVARLAGPGWWTLWRLRGE